MVINQKKNGFLNTEKKHEDVLLNIFW